jgi:hypothetical protein
MATIEVTKPNYTFEEGVHRVISHVQDKPLWFETADISIRPSAEAFLSAILVPAFESSCDITIDAPLSPVWMSNIEEMSKVFAKWWAYRGVEFHGVRKKTHIEAGNRKTALCFSGGVDSFYNLLRGSHKIDYLVSAYGFDIPVGNADRIASFHRSLRDISEATNTTSIAVTTNLREHPVSAYASWPNSHGGALAALGHLLNHHFDRLIVSASYALDCDVPWGSHWKIDHLWSSESLQVIHAGNEIWRSDKLREIMNEPLVRKHLRVCFQNTGSSPNCGCCEKCIRTMLVLAQSRQLDYFPGFENRESLAESVNKLSRIGQYLMKPYQKLLERGVLDKPLAEAVEGLLKRSRRVRIVPKKFLKNQFHEISKRIKRPFKKKLKIIYSQTSSNEYEK